MNKTIVFKCGGSVIKEISDDFFANLQQLKTDGWKFAIVHGGGPEITSMLQKLQISTEFVKGQRKTTKQVLEVAEMVLSGKMNKFFVNRLASHGLKAVGISGTDGGLLHAEYLDKKVFGEVGKIKKVDSKLLNSLMDEGFIPVIAPLASTESCQTLNVNADLAASAVAGELKADKLMYVTDVSGILNNGKLEEELTPENIRELIFSEVITGGMIPKVESALSALSECVKEVMIVNGKGSFLSKNDFIGTKIIKEKEYVS
jgi:acetylglutamate kinase